MSYHNRGISISKKISYLFSALDSQTYDEVAPVIESWIEVGLTQDLTTEGDLIEQVLDTVAWTGSRNCSHSSFTRFLKEFRDSPHRSAQAKSFVDGICTRRFRWFLAASADDLSVNWSNSVTARNGGNGFIEEASVVGHLIEYQLLDHELVRLHLIKGLTHHYPYPLGQAKTVRAAAIYRLFAVAGKTLLRGLLEPEDVRVCFEMLETQLSSSIGTNGLSTANLQEFRELHATWLQRREEERQDDEEGAGGREGEGGEAAAEIPADVETPVAFPQDLPAIVDIDIPSPILQPIEASSVSTDAEFPPDAFADDRITTVSSPTLSISTVSDLAPTEFDEDVGEYSNEQIITRHETFYLEDGNVEIVCGLTLFRVHSPIISFSSPKLRDALSPSVLLNVPMPEGCPRVTFKDRAGDFAVLLKMIYTPGFPARNRVPEFTVFASLLRMATKYGFSDVRDGLVGDLKSAYPARWEDFRAAEVLGEDVFGSPKPHPNAVLNLFLEQKITFGLPFAAYRAGRAGFSSLVSEEPGAALPRLPLASTIYGMEKIRRTMVQLSHSIVYNGNLRVCPREGCVLNADVNPIERRMEALKKVVDEIIGESKGELLSPLSLGDLICGNCARLVEASHLHCREQFVWRSLPSLLGVGGSGRVSN